MRRRRRTKREEKEKREKAAQAQLARDGGASLYAKRRPVTGEVTAEEKTSQLIEVETKLK